MTQFIEFQTSQGRITIEVSHIESFQENSDAQTEIKLNSGALIIASMSYTTMYTKLKNLLER